MSEGRIDKPSAEDESAAREAFGSLHDLQPPKELRARNQARMQEALAASLSASAAKRNMAGDRQYLWHRRVSVPMPVAALFLLVFVGLAALQLVESGENTDSLNFASTTSAPGLSPGAPPPAPALPSPSPAQTFVPSGNVQLSSGCTPVLHRESVVIAGLGPIQTKDIYICESETP